MNTRFGSLRIRRYLNSTVLESRRVPLLSFNPQFHLQRFRLQVILNMGAHISAGATYEKIDDGAETKEAELDVLRRQRNIGAKD